jgi:hypothetical protein
MSEAAAATIWTVRVRERRLDRPRARLYLAAPE